MSWIERTRGQLSEQLWSDRPLARPLAWLRSVAQLVAVIGEGFVRDELVLRAHSLTYLTMLAMVPLLALAVTFARLVDVEERVLHLILDQLTATVPEARAYLTEWTRGLDFGALGPVSGAVLIATTVLAVGAIEKALNAIWGISQQRPWLRRVPDYLAVLVIAPLLLGVAIPLRATLESQWVVQRLLQTPGLAQLYDLGLQYAPLLMIFLGFSFMYWFLPNTAVRVVSSLLGGAVGAVLFAVAQWAYIQLNLGATRYNAIFGGFAAVPLFIVWVFFSWAIFLLGAEVAYAHQTLARYRREVRGAPAGAAAREAVALAIALECARAFRDGTGPWSVDGLSEALDVPLRTVREVAEALEQAGLLAPFGSATPDRFQLGRPAEQVRIADVLGAVRGSRDVALADPQVAAQVRRALDGVEEAAGRVARERSLRDLLQELDREGAGRGAGVPAPAPPAVERGAASS